MAVITIRNIDESVKSRLRVQAAQHGRSMEEEARQIIAQGLRGAAAQPGLGSRMAQRVAGLGGVVLPVPARSPVRSPVRPPPDFGDEATAPARKTRAPKPIASKAAAGRKR